MAKEDARELVTNFKSRIKKSRNLVKETEEFVNELEEEIFDTEEDEEAEEFLKTQQEIETKIDELCDLVSELCGTNTLGTDNTDKLNQVIKDLKELKEWIEDNLKDAVIARTEIKEIVQLILAREADATLRPKLEELIEVLRLSNGDSDFDELRIKLVI